MDLTLRGQKIHLEDADLIGAGGEARVFRHGSLALKVFHPAPPGREPEAVAARQALARKRQKLIDFPSSLPPSVIAPIAPLIDSRREVVGYAMTRVEGGHDLARLAQKRWRSGRLDNAAVCAIFRDLRGTLLTLHGRRIVVGDLNDGNVLCRDAQAFLIDTDSLQFEPHLCTVAHERTLDPRLYGVALDTTAAFTPGSDWYAFATLLFSSLLFVHPFGGVHPTHKTLLRRAEARHSILRDDVLVPATAAPIDGLSDELRDWFEAVFEKDLRAAPPEGLLLAPWRQCTCGLAHAKRRCPRCAVRVAVSPAAEVPGIRARRVPLEGPLLAVGYQPQLRTLTLTAAGPRREHGVVLPLGSPRPGARFGLCGRTTWVAQAGEALQFRDASLIARHPIASFGDEPAFAANGTDAFFVQRDWLVSGEGARLGKVLEGQTWLRVGERLGFGFYRAGRCTIFFLFDPLRPGLRELTLPSLEGRLLDAACAIDESHVYFTAALELGGKRVHRSHLIRRDGAVLASLEGDPEEERALASLHGNVVRDGRIVTATNEGLLSLGVAPGSAAASPGRLIERALFAETRSWVSADVELHPTPSGGLAVATPESLVELTLG